MKQSSKRMEKKKKAPGHALAITQTCLPQGLKGCLWEQQRAEISRNVNIISRLYMYEAAYDGLKHFKP